MIQSKSVREEVERVVEIIKDEKPYLIAIAGVPGAGKSTIAFLISQALPKSQIVPMDGYHLYRNELDQQGMRRRGAAFTFNKQKFKKDTKVLKENKHGKFPSFDHKVKDPIESDIQVTLDHECIIMQGLYLFYDDWELNDLWDFKIWVQCDADDAIDRVSKRHLQSGIEPTMEQSINRANTNDKVNLQQILSHSNLSRAHIIHNSNDSQP